VTSEYFKDITLSSLKEKSVYKDGTASLQSISKCTILNKDFSFDNILLITEKS